jgi:hypothetical protein
MAQADTFTETLAVALQRVADEHEAHLKVHGPDKPWPDSDWPRWYAERLTTSLGDDRAEMQGILETALRHAASAHGVHEEFVLKGVHDVEWPAWYAEQMTGTLGANASRLEPGIKAYLAS